MKLRMILAAAGLGLLAACAPATAPAPAPAVAPAPAIQRSWSPDQIENLKALAAAAPAEGLPAESAAIAEIEALERGGGDEQAAATQLDIVAGELFARLARSFAQGAIDPGAVDSRWRMARPAFDLPALEAARTQGALPSEILAPLLPSSAEYAALRDELTRVSAEPAGALDGEGLDRETRIVRLRANLERWRWLPRALPADRLDVRIAEQEVRLIRAGIETRRHAAIIGKPATPTPSFVAEVRSVTLNPSWEPPLSILRGELLPRFRRDPAAAQREGYDVLDRDGRIVAFSDVDWSARPFPYRLRARPGPANPLGQIRFDLPNPYAVYLHDTSARGLFARTARALSHGCVRVNDAVGLAEAVISSPAWDHAALEARIDEGTTFAITLETPLPVYLLYFTAAPDADGRIVYAEDVYKLDAALVAALDAPDAARATANHAERATCPA